MRAFIHEEAIYYNNGWLASVVSFQPDCDVERSLAVQSEPMRRPAWSRHYLTFTALLQSCRSRYGLMRPRADLSSSDDIRQLSCTEPAFLRDRIGESHRRKSP
jgi:hypothetical protein